MDEGFACPDCGCEIRLKGLSPGRQVHCDWCKALVEVPFLPRAEPIKRMRQDRRLVRRKRWPAWANAALIVLTVAIVLAGAARFLRFRQRSAESDMLDRMVESSHASETSGRLEAALSELEGALALARKLNPPPAGLDEITRHRDALARREAGERLKRLSDYQPKSGDEPAQSIGQALTLLARAEKDPALSGEGMRDSIVAVLDQLRTRWASADARSCEQALAAGQPERAMMLCVRMHASTEDLSSPAGKQLRDQAHALAARIIERHGTVIEPVTGQFTLGTAESYASLIRPTLHLELQKHGFLPRTGPTPWDDLWLSHSPYKVTLVIHERQDDVYLDSQNRITTLESRLSLLNGSQTIWYQAPNSRTQVPLPGVPALQASRMASGDHRSREFERLLYINARDALLERLGANLHNLARCHAQPPDS